MSEPDAFKAPSPDPRRPAAAKRRQPRLGARAQASGARPVAGAFARARRPGGPSRRPGDAPASVAARYFTEPRRGGGALAYYEGPGAKRIAFTDRGAKLVTEQTHPAVIRDLAAIAAHRGWSLVRVTGSDAFRREMWMEARALGLEVKGYRPQERDQQELARRREPTRSSARTPDREVRGAATPRARAGDDARPPRPDYDKGVSGVLLEAGEAPYRRRTGQPVTPFVRLDPGDGRQLEIWGVGLPEALARSKAQTGDEVHVQRDGVELVRRRPDPREAAQGSGGAPRREGGRNRWVIEAERFRTASPAQAARDSTLSGAQTHLRVLDSVIDGAVRDPERRARLHAEARALVADELARGRRFTPARVREVEPALARDVAEARGRDAARDRALRR